MGSDDEKHVGESNTNEPSKRASPGVAKPSQTEVGGQSGPEPTRYGDWEKAGRCSDF